MTRVTIFHNVARDEAGRPLNFDGYTAGAPLVRVFEYDHPRTESVEQIAEHAFYLFNVDPCHLQPDDYEIARRYRARQLRSLSAGDVIRAADAALAIDPIGFRPIEGGQLVTVIIEDTHFRILHGEEELAIRPRKDPAPITRLYVQGKDTGHG